jgi:hypothetical protein
MSASSITLLDFVEEFARDAGARINLRPVAVQTAVRIMMMAAVDAATTNDPAMLRECCFRIRSKLAPPPEPMRKRRRKGEPFVHVGAARVRT